MNELLSKFDVLAELGADEREELSFSLERREIGEGTIVFRTDDETNELFFVAEGTVKLESDKRVIGMMGPGEVIGAMSPVVVGRRECDARTSTPVVLYVLSREAYFRLSMDQPAVALKLTEGVLRSVANLLRGVLADRRAV